MTKASWGAKRHCPSCGARFYDLGKNPAACPKCKYVQDINAPVRTRRGRAKTPPALAVVAKAAAKPDLKPKKPIKEIEGVDLGKFEDIKTMGGDDDIEELEEMEDDMASIEKIDIEEGGDEEEEMDEVSDKALIDTVDDDESEDDEEDEEDDRKKSRGKAPRAKAGPKPAPAKKKKRR